MKMPLALLQAVLTRSAQGELAVIFMVAITFLSVGFVAWSCHLTQQRLIDQREEFKILLGRHLGQPIALALWNFDPANAGILLDSELGGNVQGLAVYDHRDQLWVQRGTPRSAAEVGRFSGVEVFSMEVPAIDNRTTGRIEVTWSDAALKKALNETLWLALAQLVGMNLVLLGIFGVGVEQLIFRRVRRLQRALDQAVNQDLTADIVALPVPLRDEFGAITQSINTITRRLGEELEAGRESEEEARAALSNLQNAQEGLVRAEKMASLGSLVAGVAHELNTPIGNLMMVTSSQQETLQRFGQSVAAGTLTRSGLDAFLDQAKEGSGLALQSATRAAELIQNFKQVAVDQASDRLRGFDLAIHIAEVLSVIAHLTSKRPVTLKRELEPGIAMYSYPGPLGQVLTNLVMNAVTHGFAQGQPGLITIACQREGDWAHITVADNGQGISAENIGKIFDPFFTTRLGQGGGGLGLHICHNIVFGPLGGRLTVQSTPGQGSIFTILMPCRVAPPP